MSPIGHFAIGLAAKPSVPKVPLWILLLCTELLDLLWSVFRVIGIESSGATSISVRQGLKILTPGIIPWSHGLFISLIWSAAFATVAFLIYRDRRISAVIGLAVFSHWALDFIVHPHELPLLFNGSPTVGLGLWSSGPGFILSMILELSLFAGGTAIYLTWRKQARRMDHAENLIREGS